MTTDHVVSLSSSGAVSATLQASEIIQRALDAVDQTILDTVSSDVDVLQQASHHILEAGGKRFRPRLMLLSFAATGGANLENVLRPAAAVELMHTASVVHDDINDHGLLRRGRPSINAIWGRTFALLTGDFLFTKVYELMAPLDQVNVLLADAAVALVEGETLQASAVKNQTLSSEVYFRIISLKTAALFKASTLIGATMAGATQDERNAMADFGFNLGLAFQIVDDILDLTGTDEQIGKTANLDVSQGKGVASVSDNPMDAVKQKMLGGDRLERAKAQAKAHIHAAVNALDAIPESPFRDQLLEVAQQVIERDH